MAKFAGVLSVMRDILGLGSWEEANDGVRGRGGSTTAIRSRLSQKEGVCAGVRRKRKAEH